MPKHSTSDGFALSRKLSDHPGNGGGGRRSLLLFNYVRADIELTSEAVEKVRAEAQERYSPGRVASAFTVPDSLADRFPLLASVNAFIQKRLGQDAEVVKDVGSPTLRPVRVPEVRRACLSLRAASWRRCPC